jgi:hypothetical protein
MSVGSCRLTACEGFYGCGEAVFGKTGQSLKFEG